MESIYPYGDRQGTFKILKDTILTIPGHATWHGEQIKQLTDAEIEGRPTGKHSLQRWWYYETLQQLPSPETVKVLGEFLFDERDPWKHLPTDDGGRWHPNSLYAVRALNKLGIRNAPVKREHWDPADLRTWQLWYEQIRAGTRTFSFEGDDAIYSLSGPVRTALDPGDILSESRRSPAAGTGAAAEAKPESSKVPLIAALSLALLSLILAARRAMLNRPA